MPDPKAQNPPPASLEAARPAAEPPAAPPAGPPVARPQRASAMPPMPLRPPRTALEQVPTPSLVRHVALGLLVASLVLLVGLVLLPWQQTAPGTGRVIATSPADREQLVQAPIKGVIVDWKVREGETVAAGQALVELSDNDPDYATRLAAKATQVALAVEAAQAKVQAAEARLTAEGLSRDLYVAETTQKVLEHRRKLVGEQAEADAAQRQLDRVATLAAEGIASARDLDVARAKASTASASVEARRAAIDGAEQARDKARQSGEAKVAKVREELEAARSSMASAETKALDIATDQARQANRLVRAPRAGVALRLHGGPGGGQVKEGDTLITLVPVTQQRSVELTIDGNDLPLVQPGQEVRLVFEGWPAIQFAGWPELARGTFGGEVSFVDATDDGKGSFRVVVVPRPNEPDWPSSGILRQGVRAKGWVMLGRVRLGYELWRQVNGFPALPPTDLAKGGGPPPNPKKPRNSKELRP